ncbi:hypothetical protein T10_13009 [Trichinella papuae]|uniref:Uncharacterized protein n=1 Tax=Trichinella papuae TaxID=268474 RepID=A0A0V1MZZ9_9BILA|nr:hypothetical protein T10_13009 [Trichinella papuae]
MPKLLHDCRTTLQRTIYYLWCDKNQWHLCLFVSIHLKASPGGREVCLILWLQLSGSRLSAVLHAVRKMQSSYQKILCTPWASATFHKPSSQRQPRRSQQGFLLLAPFRHTAKSHGRIHFSRISQTLSKPHLSGFLGL